MIATVAPAPADLPAVEPADAPARALSRWRPRWRWRRPSTPSLLRLGMALACVPVALFAVAVQVGVARHDSTVRTVGRDATRGITVAQAIKLNLAELDEIAVRDLRAGTPLGRNGFTDAYNDKRSELHENLVLAAAESSSGAAYRQPLANIDYALAHYHSMVEDAFGARAQGDTARAAQLYGQAHEVAAGTLLSEADFVDKANTYVLNDSYDRQKARADSTVRLIVVSWVVLLAALVIGQLLLARRFRRLVNLGLAAATVLTVATGLFALGRLDAASADLTTAREQAFDSVHVLARARASVVAARQSQGQLLLDPGGRADAEAAFRLQAEDLFRAPGRPDLAGLARSGTVPEGAGGYLARVASAGAGGARDAAAERALVAFGDFLAADAEMRRLVAEGDTAGAVALYEDGAAFDALTVAIDDAQARDQAAFDRHADAAADAAGPVDRLALAGAAGILGLVLLGLYQRLREYRT